MCGNRIGIVKKFGIIPSLVQKLLKNNAFPSILVEGAPPFIQLNNQHFPEHTEAIARSTMLNLNVCLSFCECVKLKYTKITPVYQTKILCTRRQKIYQISHIWFIDTSVGNPDFTPLFTASVISGHDLSIETSLPLCDLLISTD